MMHRPDRNGKKRHKMAIKQVDAQKRSISSGYGNLTSPLAIMGGTNSVYSSRVETPY